MAKQMGKWVDQVIGQGFQKYRPAEPWSPAINLYEDETHYCVVVELAGIDAEQIELRAEGRKLTLRGVRNPPGISKSAGRVHLHHMEIDHGPFNRSLELPEDVDADQIEAWYKFGLLWIQLPKKAS